MVPTLTIKDTPQDVLGQHVHCRTTTAADSLAAALAPTFDKLIDDWTVTNTARIQLVIAIAQARANAFQLDVQLDAIVDALVLALKRLTTSRSDTLWDLYLKGIEPAVLKSPILSLQLTRMTVWPTSLNSSPHKELNDIGAELAPLLGPAKAAETAVAVAEQALRDFDTVGKWLQHIDLSNATRAAAFGTLLDVPHQNPTLKLPTGYADLFFLHDTSRRGANKPKSSKEIGDEITALKIKLGLLDTELKEAVNREAKAAADEAEREQKQKERDALDQQEKDIKARKKEIEKELGKKK